MGKTIAALAKAGEAFAIDLVERTLMDPSRDVRWMAAKTLDKLVNKLANPDAYERAARQLHHEDDGVRTIAIQANAKLVETGKYDLIPDVLNGLKDSSDNVRRKTLEALGEILVKNSGLPTVREAVFGTCTDADYRLRLTAVKIMAKLVEAKDPDAFAAMNVPLQDFKEDDYVRLAAMEAMGTLAENGYAGATEAVVAGATDPSWRVKHVALKVMGKLVKNGDPLVLEAVKVDRLERRQQLPTLPQLESMTCENTIASVNDIHSAVPEYSGSASSGSSPTSPRAEETGGCDASDKNN